VPPGSVVTETATNWSTTATRSTFRRGWSRPVPTNPQRPPHGTVQIRSGDTTAYGAAALRCECQRVRDAKPGRHNEVLS
jgi:hypothetical protein